MLALIPLLTGCETIGANVKEGMAQAPCAAFHPVYTHPGDALSPRTAKQILQNNLTGQDLCGWKQKHELKLNGIKK
jgi:hypothetical protein